MACCSLDVARTIVYMACRALSLLPSTCCSLDVARSIVYMACRALSLLLSKVEVACEGKTRLGKSHLEIFILVGSIHFHFGGSDSGTCGNGV